MEIGNSTSDLEHEASVSKVSSDQLFYLMSRGFTKMKQWGLLLTGSLNPLREELLWNMPFELNKLLELEMEGSIG